MWDPWHHAARWARISNEHAVRNARVAAVECSRRCVERAEVELWLRRREDAVTVSRHPA